MKMFVLLIGLFTVLSLAAKPLPVAPKDCFSSKNFCSTVDVVRDSADRRVIRVAIFANLPKSSYPTVQDVAERYLDFAKWPDYAAGSDDVVFRQSEDRSESTSSGEKIRHFAHYSCKAPWPIRNMEVVDLLDYQFVTADYPGSLYSATFAPAANFRGRKGVKHNVGELHITASANGQAWTVFFVTDVIPDVDLLPNVAAPYIQRPMLAILRGMFQL